MGMCISNQSAVEVQNGPVTYSKPYAGQPPITKKTKMTQYPGNRRPLNEPYVPAESEFAYNATNGQSRVTKHFVNYGGGNALTLVDGPPPSNGTTSSGKQYIQVTLPPGSYPGEELHVRSPDGQMIAIAVPEGMSEGELFTVEFQPQSSLSSNEQQYAPAVASPTNGGKAYENLPVAVPMLLF